MGLVLVTAPAVEPVTTAEAKAHMRVDSSTEDAYIDTLIAAARQVVEKATGRALVTQTWDLWWDVPAKMRVVRLPLPPLQSVTHVKYYTTDDVENVFGSINYYVDVNDLQGGRLSLTEGSVWPVSSLRYVNSFVVRFVAGYGAAADVPADLKHAIKLLVAHWFEIREPINVGNIVNSIPLMFEHVIYPYKIFRI